MVGFVLVLIVLSLRVPIYAKESGFTIEKNRARIVIPANPSAKERDAAGLLKDYLEKVFGFPFSIVPENANSLGKNEGIFIGNTGLAELTFPDFSKKLEQDGYRIVITRKNVLLLGGSRHGITYAITAFLEDYIGCRRFTEEEEYVPQKTSLNLPISDTTSLPAVDVRIINGPMASQPGVKAWRRLTTIADDWRDGEWSGYYVHTFNRLVPPAKFFDSHPEYFGLINGQRKPYAQLCLTNPHVLQRVVDTLRQEMAAHPTVQYWSVSQNDDFEYCRCERCAKVDEEEGSPSGLILRFVNQVADSFPDKTITTLAYSYTRHAPKKTRPHSNVLITLCSIEMDRSEAISASASGTSFVEDLMTWSNLTDNLMIWDYEVQFTNYISPFPLFHTLQPNLQLFNKYHAKAHFQQCNIDRGVEFAPLKMYVLSKLLWNTEVNVDSVVHDFTQHYYGAAGPFIQQYFDRLHQEEKESKQSLDIYGTPVAFTNTLLSNERMADYYAYFDQAESAVANDSILLERVKVARLPILFGEMEIAKSDLFGERGWFVRQGDDFIPRQEKTALLDTFSAVCARNNIVYMNENGLTVGLYRSSTERFLDIKVKGDLAFEKKVTCTTPPDTRYFLKGEASLTDGVKGTERYRMNWLGWEGMDMGFTIDLGNVSPVKSAAVSTMHYPQAWIIRPDTVTCSISEDGINFRNVGSIITDSDASKEPLIRSFEFPLTGKARYVRFEITGTKTLPVWHTYTGHKSWIFVDEAEVR